MKRNRKITFGVMEISLVAAFILTSCAGAATGVTASPTTAPILPTATLTAVPTTPPTATLAPSATAAPTAVPTVVPTAQVSPQVNPGMNANCRKGPGTSYDVVTYLQVGTFYPVIGRNGLNSWWLVQFTPNISCWMGDPTAVFQGVVDQVPILQAPPLPGTPSSFTVSYVCDSAVRSLIVTFDWAPVVGATGYRIYRNGDLLAEFDANIVNGRDPNPPLAVDLVYELQAFNQYGVSPRLRFKTISACGD